MEVLAIFIVVVLVVEVVVVVVVLVVVVVVVVIVVGVIVILGWRSWHAGQWPSGPGLDQIPALLIAARPRICCK